MSLNLTYAEQDRKDNSPREWRLSWSHDLAVEQMGLIGELQYGIAFEPNHRGLLVISHQLDGNFLKAPLSDKMLPALMVTRVHPDQVDSGWRAGYDYKKMRDFGFPHPDAWNGAFEVLYKGGGICRMRMLDIDMPLVEPKPAPVRLRGV